MKDWWNELSMYAVLGLAMPFKIPNHKQTDVNLSYLMPAKNQQWLIVLSYLYTFDLTVRSWLAFADFMQLRKGAKETQPNGTQNDNKVHGAECECRYA